MKNIKLNDYVRTNFAHINKNSTLEEYRRECTNLFGFDSELVKIEHIIDVDSAEYKRISENLLDSCPAIAGKGGNDSSYQTDLDYMELCNNPAEMEKWRSGSYICGVLIRCGNAGFIADPQGHDYIRYVGIDIMPAIPAQKKQSVERGAKFRMQHCHGRFVVSSITGNKATAITEDHCFITVSLSSISDITGHVLESDIINAEKVATDKKEASDNAQNEKDAEDTRLAAIGEKLWAELIGNAPAVIVAEYYKDEIDSMTDYFGGATKQTVILATSKHTRDLFPEMRNAAALIPETEHFKTDPQKDSEQRQKYSMGSGFFLGKSYSSGWRVRKNKFYGTPTKPDYIDLAKRNDHLNTATKPAKFEAKKETLKPATTEQPKTGVKIIDYSEKACAIIGDTKPIKDDLKKLGARFNPKLSCGAGWIISKKRKADFVHFI